MTAVAALPRAMFEAAFSPPGNRMQAQKALLSAPSDQQPLT